MSDSAVRLRDLDARIDAVRQTLVDRGGVARVRVLRRSGASAHVIAASVASGQVVRIRKGWLALPGADPDLIRAATAGVVLTCVTQTRRMGLWAPDDADVEPHVGAAAHSGGVRVERAHVHWCRTPIPRHPDELVDPIENALAIVARCRPWEDALAIWESALNRGMVGREVLDRLDLPTVARRILEASTPWSDSGLETLVRTRLAWLRLPIHAQAWVAGHRVDFLIGERLVLQVDGGHHVGRQRESDIRHDAELMLRGYHVIRVGYAQVMERWPEVQAQVMRAVAQGLHRTR